MSEEDQSTVDESEREDEPDTKQEASADEQGSDQSDDEQGDDQSSDEEQELQETMEKLQEDPPEKLEDWPEGKAKYETFGGPEGEHGYHEGPEEKLGPSSLRFHEDGRVEVAGDEVDDPDQYKGEPIPGGPTDPDAPQDLTTERIRGGDAAARNTDEDDDDGDGESDGDKQESSSSESDD
jgi:hypothetical protein